MIGEVDITPLVSIVATAADETLMAETRSGRSHARHCKQNPSEWPRQANPVYPVEANARRQMQGPASPL